MTNRWTIEVQEDPDTGDAILEFPPELMEQAGWQEGDTLTWKDLGNGSWSLTKQVTDVTIEEEEAWRDLENKQTKA
jgi:predicted transcriptional regulator